jgi:lipopolysaccharide export LptBFGC system permease protein LptF
MLVHGNLNAGSFFKLLLILCPYIISYSLPMAVLLSTLMSFGRLSTDNEITAIKAGGGNLFSIVIPVIMAGIFMSVLLAILNADIVPETLYRRKLIVREVNPLSFLTPGQNSIGKYTLFFKRRQGQEIFEVVISQGGEEGINAEKGILTFVSNTLMIELFNGTRFQTIEGGKSVKNKFGSYILTIFFPKLSVPNRELDEKKLSFLLFEFFKSKKRKNMSGEVFAEINRRISLGFACLSFVLIGIPLGITAHRKSKSISFGKSLMLVLIYYVLLISAGPLADKGICPLALALWLPNIILGGAGVVLLYFKI